MTIPNSDHQRVKRIIEKYRPVLDALAANPVPRYVYAVDRWPNPERGEYVCTFEKFMEIAAMATPSASEEPHPTLADVNAELSALVRHMENNAAQALDLLRRCRPNVGAVGALAEDIDRFLKWGADISNGGDDDN